MDGWSNCNNSFDVRPHFMRLFLVSFALSAILTAATALAQNDEPLTGGSAIQQRARFEVSPAQQYLVARARSESMERAAFLRHYDWMGYDYAHPQVNAGVFTLAQPPLRIRRYYSYPGVFIDSRGYGY
jgi:hypothetical protein